MPLHLIKLCVGCDSVEDLTDWWREQLAAGRACRVHTRQTPRRAEELIGGGSLYWVIKGFVLCRQRIVGVETVGEGVAARCHVALDPEIVLTQPTPRRAFQGWRYLEAKDAPMDLGKRRKGEQDLPPELLLELRQLGIL